MLQESLHGGQQRFRPTAHLVTAKDDLQLRDIHSGRDANWERDGPDVIIEPSGARWIIDDVRQGCVALGAFYHRLDFIHIIEHLFLREVVIVLSVCEDRNHSIKQWLGRTLDATRCC